MYPCAPVITEAEKSRLWSANGISSSQSLRPKAGEDVPQLEDSHAERENSFLLILLFYSGLNELEEVHPHWVLLPVAQVGGGLWLNTGSQRRLSVCPLVPYHYLGIWPYSHLSNGTWNCWPKYLVSLFTITIKHGLSVQDATWIPAFQ